MVIGATLLGKVPNKAPTSGLFFRALHPRTFPARDERVRDFGRRLVDHLFAEHQCARVLVLSRFAVRVEDVVGLVEQFLTW